MSEQPRACWCVARGRPTCACDVPFIGNFAEADRRMADGTLRSLDMADVKAAVKADIIAHVERLIPPQPERAIVTIVMTGNESND